MLICGLDEVGRGPIAGPVVASAVLWDSPAGIEGLDDSKKLSPAKREKLLPIIEKHAIAWATAWIWPEEIDRINILQASLLAMVHAFDSMVEQLATKGMQDTAFAVRVDGNRLPDFSLSKKYHPELHGDCQAIVGGDHLVDAISGASILAKVARDRWMCDYAKKEPHYGFEKHKGYPTKEHRAAVLQYGPSAIQRMSFRVR